MREAAVDQSPADAEGTYFVKQRLVQSRIFSLQFVNFFIELGLDVSAFDLEVLEGIDASLHNLW